MENTINSNSYFIKDTKSKSQWKDKDFVLEQVKKNGLAFYYASKEFKNDKEIVLAAVKKNGDAIRYASKELINNTEILLEAIKQDPFILGESYIEQTLKDIILISQILEKRNLRKKQSLEKLLNKGK